MVEEQTITCIMCPLGCKIRVLQTGDTVEIKGAGCDNGREYALQEISEPSRIIMSVVPVRNSDIPTVTVKTNKSIPKEKIGRVMELISTVEVTAPIKVGDIILKNIDNMHVDIIATRNAKERY